MSSEFGDPETRERIIGAARAAVTENGAGLTIADVAKRAGVSRQSVYLHFRDRTGLLVALVQYMDTQLDLGASLEKVQAAENGGELLSRTMELHSTFNQGIDAVSHVLEGAQYHDEAIGTAWRDRLDFRFGVHQRLVGQLAAWGALADGWNPEDAAAIFYAVTLPGPWRELTRELGWAQEKYIEQMTTFLSRALLR